MTLLKEASSLKDLQNWIKDWLKANRDAVQLDGSPSKKCNPSALVTMELSDIENLSGKISFHGDTKREALEEIVKLDITNFIIVPPRHGFRYWRFHFAKTHGYSYSHRSEGLYAYVKSPDSPLD